MPAFPVIEFRQYRLHPGARETLIDLFEAEFIESQEACGMTVIGQFRDLDDSDCFTWLRGFQSWEARPVALSRFYEGPVWAAHREAANATMIDSDDVHLLRPVADDGFMVDLTRRPAPDSSAESDAVYLVVLCTLDAGAQPDLSDATNTLTRPSAEAGGELVGAFTTLNAANNWPRLPVHEDRNVGIWLMRFADEPAADRAISNLSAEGEWKRAIEGSSDQPVEIRRLAPTRRSALR